MIGAHELLLIVRAQNQASAALGRVGADIRRLQAQRDLGRRQSALENQTLQARTRLQSIISTNGAKNLQIQARRLAIEHQVEAINARTVGLDQRRAAIQVRANNLKLQEVRLEDRLLGLAGKRAAATASIARAEATVMGTQRKIESLQYGGQAFATTHLGVSKARTGIDAATLSQMRAARAFDRIKTAGLTPNDPIYKERELASSIASQRLTQANRSYEIARMGVKALDAQIEHLQITLHGQKSSLIAAQEALTNLNRSEREIKLQIENVTASWDHLNARERAVIATEQQHQREIEGLTSRLKILNAEQKEMGIAASILGHNIKNNLGPDLENIATEKAVQRMERYRVVLAGIGHVGRVVMMGGLVGTAVAGYAAHTAAQFQTQATLAATQARKPGAGVGSTLAISGQIQKTVLNQMNQFPASANEMNQALYDIFSSTNVQNMKQASNMLAVFNKMAVAGGTDLKTMTDAGISLYNNFGGLHGEFKNMTQAGNAFFAAVRYGRMNAAQFADSLSNVIPIAKEAGLNFQDVAGAMAQLTRQSGAKFTSRDATGLARMIQFLARPEAMAGLKKWGVEAETTGGKLQHLPKLLGDIAKMMKDRGIKPGPETLNFFKELTKAGGSSRGATGTIQATRAFAYLIGNIQKYQRTQRQVLKDTNEMNKAFGAMSQTPGVRWAIFMNVMKNLAIQIGTGVIPAVMQLGKFLSPMVKYFEGLSTSTKHAIGYFVAFAGLASLVGGALLTVVGGIGAAMLGMRTVGQSFGIFGGQAKTAATGLKVMSTEAGFVSLKMGLGLGIPAAIFLMIKFHKQVAQVVHLLGGFGNAISILMTIVVAAKFTSLILGLRGVTLAEMSATTWAGRLKLALMGLSAPGALGGLGATLAKYAKGAGLFFGAELPAIPDMIKVLQGKDPFKKLVQPASLSRAAKTAVYGRNSVSEPYTTQMGKDVSATTGRGATLAHKFGFSSPKKLLDAFLAHHITAAEVDIFVANWMKRDPKVAQDFLNRTLRHSDLIPSNAPKIARRNATIANATDQIARAHLAGKMPTITTDTKGHTIIVQKHVRSIQEWIRLVERAQKVQLANPNSIKAAQKYESLVRGMNAAFKDQPDLLAAANDVMQNYGSSIKSAVNDAKTLGVTFNDVLSGIQSRYDQFKQQEESNFGQLFSGPYVNSPRVQNNLQFGGKLTGKDLVKDYRSQITQFKTLQGQYNKLQRKGAPTELMAQLRAMGPDALQNLKALNTLSKPEINKYFGLFKQGQKLVHDQTMRDLNRQLKQYSKYGKNVALQIVAGLKSEQPAVQNELERIVKKMFPGLPVGKTGAGGKPTHTRAPSHTTIHNTYNNHTHVVAPKRDSLSVKAQIRHADLTRRNRYSGRGGVPR